MIRKKPLRKMKAPVRDLENFPGKLFDEFEEPKTWTIITALDRILELAQDSQLSDDFWNSAKNPLDFLNKELGLTNIQIVALAMLIESGEPMSWKGMGNYLGCSRLSVMVYSEEIEELVTKRWAIRRSVREIGGCFEGLALVHGVITALRHNKTFVPEKIDGLTEQQFVDKLEKHVTKNMNNRHVEYKDDEEWMLMLTQANPQLPLCQEVLSFDDIHTQSLLLLIVVDYAQWEGSEGEGLTMNVIDDLYPDELESDFMRDQLRDGVHPLIQMGYIEHKCVDGQANNEQYILTRKAKTLLLSDYAPSHSMCRKKGSTRRFLKSHQSIKEKTLFFNKSEQQQIDRLTSP